MAHTLVAVEIDDMQIWQVAANTILNKQYWVDKRKLISSFGVGQEPLIPQHEIETCFDLLLDFSG
jgi:hypothetical protein